MDPESSPQARFLEGHRVPIAGYDRIRFDEAEVARLRERLNVDTPLEVRWDWDYIKEIESLRGLYEKGKVKQWNVETDIDWSLDVPSGALLLSIEDSRLGAILKMCGRDEATIVAGVRAEVEWYLSQLLHGEQAALQLCAQLVNSVPILDMKLFAGQQVMDECRHVEMFSKLLARKFGTIHPVAPDIKYLLDEMLSTSSWHQKLIGMQVIFEGVAMSTITDLGQRTLNPLVGQALRLVARDEARHAAFGVLGLRDEIASLSKIEHDALEDWTWKCLEVIANGLMSSLIDEVVPKFGVSPDRFAKAVFSTGSFWDRRYHMFNHTVLPNLRRLGLITDRTRPNYDRFRLWGEHAPFGASGTGAFRE